MPKPWNIKAPVHKLRIGIHEVEITSFSLRKNDSAHFDRTKKIRIPNFEGEKLRSSITQTSRKIFKNNEETKESSFGVLSNPNVTISPQPNIKHPISLMQSLKFTANSERAEKGGTPLSPGSIKNRISVEPLQLKKFTHII